MSVPDEGYSRNASCALNYISTFSAISWREQVNEMMMMSSLYYTNTPSWSFIVLTHWNNSSRVHMWLLSGHIILIPSQPVLLLSTAFLAEKQKIRIL